MQPIAVPSAGAEEGAAEDVDQATAFEFTVVQLQDQRRLLVYQGKTEEHPLVIALAGQIKAQEQARLAEKPGHVRIARAERLVKQCKQAIEAGAGRKAKLLADIASLQALVAAADQQAVEAQQALAEAEKETVAVLSAIQAEGPVQGPLPGSGDPLASVADTIEAGTDDEWGKLGLNVERSIVVELLRRLGALVPIGSQTSAPESVAPQASEGAASAGSGVDLTVDDCMGCWASQGPAVSREELAAQLVASHKRRKVGETAVVPAIATR